MAVHNHHNLVAYNELLADENYKARPLAELVANAHQVILNAPRPKDESDRRAMLLLELAYGRLEGTPLG